MRRVQEDFSGVTRKQQGSHPGGRTALIGCAGALVALTAPACMGAGGGIDGPSQDSCSFAGTHQIAAAGMTSHLHDALAKPAPPRPVIIIPGLFGTILEQKNTGRKIWGSYFARSAVSLQRSLGGDRYDGLDLPTTSTTLLDDRDSIVPAGLLQRETIIPHLLSINVYRRWVRTLGHAGYHDADITHPKKGDTCFVFFYDWRRDLVENARLLAERVDAIRAAYGEPDLKVDIVAHSMGGLIARYYLLYGGEDVLGTDRPPQPTMAGAAHVAHLALLASPNEGSLPSFFTLVEGGRVAGKAIPFLVWFSFPSLYELLPPPGSPVFIDEAGRPVGIDLHDAEAWRANHWGIYDRKRSEGYRNEFREALGQDAERAFTARSEEWSRFLTAALTRARRFHAAIALDKEASLPFAYHLFGGGCMRTLGRCMLRKTEAGLRPVARPSDRPPGMSRAAFDSLLFEPGDGTVTGTSLLGLIPFAGAGTGGAALPAMEPTWTGAEVSWSCVRHDRIQSAAAVQCRVIEIFRSGE